VLSRPIRTGRGRHARPICTGGTGRGARGHLVAGAEVGAHVHIVVEAEDAAGCGTLRAREELGAVVEEARRDAVFFGGGRSFSLAWFRKRNDTLIDTLDKTREAAVWASGSVLCGVGAHVCALARTARVCVLHHASSAILSFGRSLDTAGSRDVTGSSL
jgi:hypothetical protein